MKDLNEPMNAPFADKDPRKEVRAARIVKSATAKVKFAIHELEHDIMLWPHTQDYTMEVIMLHTIAASLGDKQAEEAEKGPSQDQQPSNN